ncbi:MAG: LysR family transcriptional regulator [Alphaproteobacteria bacterium]
MEMHQVRYFLALCETLNFTRAAEQCHVAQPSLTRAIKKLEAEFGGELFRRERNLTHLTALGRALQPHLADVVAASDAAATFAREARRGKRAPITLGVMSTLSPAHLATLLRHLHQHVPDLDLTIAEASCHGLVECLMEGEVDVGLLALPNLPDRVDARPLFDERYMIAFARGHRFEQMNGIPMRELDGEDYLVRLHCEFADHFDALGGGRDFKTRTRQSAEREDWVQAMILAGVGCAVMPEYLPTLPGVVMRPIVDPAVTRTVSLATVAGRRYSPTLRLLIDAVGRHDWRQST